MDWIHVTLDKGCSRSGQAPLRLYQRSVLTVIIGFGRAKIYLSEYCVWNLTGRRGQRIDTDRDSMESKQLQTVRLNEGRNTFNMFTRPSINNNIIFIHLAQFNVCLIITPTAYDTYIRRSTSNSSRSSRSRGVSGTSGLAVENMNLNSLGRRDLRKSQFKNFWLGLRAPPNAYNWNVNFDNLSSYFSNDSRRCIPQTCHIMHRRDIALKHRPFAFETSNSKKCSRYSDWLRVGRPRGRTSSPGRIKKFLFSKSSRPALGSTQPPIQLAPGVLSPGEKRPGREADHTPPARAESRKCGSIRPLPHTPSWRSA
jgi:hypothetical protein